MTAEPAFGVKIESSDRAVTLTVQGDLDIATVDELRRARTEALAGAPQKVLIDLGGVAFVDSSGLKFLIDTHRLAQQEGWELALLRPPDAAMKVFAITGADRHLPFVERET